MISPLLLSHNRHLSFQVLVLKTFTHQMILSNLSKDLIVVVVPTIVNFAPMSRHSLVWSRTMLSQNIFQTHFRINVNSVTLSWGLILHYIVMFNECTNKWTRNWWHFYLKVQSNIQKIWTSSYWRNWETVVIIIPVESAISTLTRPSPMSKVIWSRNIFQTHSSMIVHIVTNSLAPEVLFTNILAECINEFITHALLENILSFPLLMLLFILRFHHLSRRFW